METALAYLAITAVTLASFTIVMLFSLFLLWANCEIKTRMAKYRGLGPVFRVTFLPNKETIIRHESEISEFIQNLEKRGKKELKTRKKSV